METLYRCLYWEKNELEIIGTFYSMKRADRIEKALNFLAARLGFHPAC